MIISMTNTNKTIRYVIIDDQTLERLIGIMKSRFRYSFGSIYRRPATEKTLAESLVVEIPTGTPPMLLRAMTEFVSGFVEGADLKSSTSSETGPMLFDSIYAILQRTVEANPQYRESFIRWMMSERKPGDDRWPVEGESGFKGAFRRNTMTLVAVDGNRLARAAACIEEANEAFMRIDLSRQES